MSFMTRTLLDPFQFSYPKKKLTIEEMVNKFIEEGRREHEEMGAFIREFKTTNELLLKERNNSLSELRFGVYELTKVIEKAHITSCEIKGVTTRGGKTTTETTHDNNVTLEPLTRNHNEPITQKEAPTEVKPKKIMEQVTKPQISPIPFPHRLKKEKEEAQQRKFLENLKQLQLNIPFTEALAQMPKYAKFLKSLLSNKTRLEEACTVTMNERCSAARKLVPCKAGLQIVSSKLMDITSWLLRLSLVNFIESILGLGEPKPTRMSLELADRSIQYPQGIAENVLIKIDKFVLPIDFVILDMREDSKIPIILGRPFLVTSRAMIDVFNKKITLRVGDEEAASEEHGEQSEPEESIRRIEIKDTTANEIDEKMPELKDLPSHLEYAYLNGDRACPVIVSSKLTKEEKISLLQVLEKHKGAIAWKMANIKDSPWVSPVHVVPKKGGMTVVLNDNNKAVLSRTVTAWRVCINYRKLNDTTRKDHFPLPFIDQMLERLMPFGLCNTHATFQRFMTAIFHDMVEDFMEVFMDDFSVFDNSFNHCLGNLDKMLARCEETNLVLNWENCHFMVKEGIVLGHKTSGEGIEVDRAKIDVIAKLPYPTNVKGAFNDLKENLTSAPIIISPNWNFPFELMCDASDFAIGAVLGQMIDGKFKPIYYTSKTLNDAQAHYTTTEKELLAVDAKTRLIRWVLLLQGFNIEIKDKKGAKNLAADHLSRPENPNMGMLTEREIADEFPDEHLMALKITPDNDEPWSNTAYPKVWDTAY
ncbi:reverse transcriptase domain-containing protein [Tanacetum coccineum]